MSDSSISQGKATITVAGVTFSSDQIVSAVVKIDGREITIAKKEDEAKSIGFKHQENSR